jgi:RNA polymerase sigma factor (sigma-70 family)
MAARAGDRAAFAALVARHRAAVVSACHRLLRDRQLAEDAYQEAVIAALVNLDRLRRPERFGAWLIGIALNTSRRWMRWRAREACSAEAVWGGRWLAEMPDTGPGPAEIAETQELVERVRRAVAALPPGQRGAVLAYYLQGLTHREVAALLGTSVGAVKTRLHKARTTLRHQLFDTWEEIRMTNTTQAVPMRVADVCVHHTDTGAAHHVVVLEEIDGDRLLPIWVGQAEATALALELTGTELPRPNAYHLTVRLLQAAGAHLREARITRLAETTYYATVTVDGPTGTPEIDARPSDALNLATLTHAPVTVEPAVLDATAQIPIGTPSAHQLLRDASAHAADIATQTVERLRAELEPLRRRETDT